MQFMLFEVVTEEDRKKKVEKRLGREELNVGVGYIYENWGKPGHQYLSKQGETPNLVANMLFMNTRAI